MIKTHGRCSTRRRPGAELDCLRWKWEKCRARFCRFGQQQARAELTDVTICLIGRPTPIIRPVWWRRAKAITKNAGLNVSIVQPPEDGATAICAAGQVEFAVTVQDSLASAFARKIPSG